MTVVTALFAWLTAASGLASPTDARGMLDRIGDGDLALLVNPQAARPVRVLLATRVAASPERVREIVTSPDLYRKAMPSFRRTDVVGRRARRPARPGPRRRSTTRRVPKTRSRYAPRAIAPSGVYTFSIIWS